MREFEYEAPTTLADALQTLSRSNGGARPLAGGTDLIDHVRSGRLRPDVLVDVKKIAELNVLEASATGLRLGAAVPCWRVVEHPAVLHDYTALADSARIIGGIQIQSRASIGGNLCNSGPAADSSPSIIALGGICVIAGPSGAREVPAEAFCTGPGTNILQPGELLVELRFPPRTPRSGSHYRRFIPRNEMDIAVVGVAASVTLDESGQHLAAVRIALGAVAPVPLLLTEVEQSLVGRPIDDSTLHSAAQAAQRAVKPITDMRGTIEYRKHLAGVLTQRVLRAAIDRAQGKQLDYQPG